ncbi:putative NTP binding protein [Aspergillus fijiensis CBS 313.89]|uniref:NTP binding protein n=1 Tax=Aspergillus fijiensis CBS 313.89 TaxID=1448319 RepID=A0A8G1VVM1_9EURO|nr:uncharacterized protein BO72DRAFT_451887 [Aspergillus fijiensis CBS 313.89]RAK73353.1 hypothetical protein BO72DRAFT_451887 [Aspergillus fijiensis CBS 313.89]
MEHPLHLPNSDNMLQLRNPRGKRTRPYDAAKPPAQATGIPGRRTEQSTQSKSEDPKTMSETAARRTKPTKLPLPKSPADKTKESAGTRLPVTETKEQESDRTIRPKRSLGALSLAAPKQAEKGGDQYWRKVRDRFEREIPAPLRSKEKHKEYYQEAYRKIVSLATSPRQEIANYKLRFTGGIPRDDKIHTRPVGLRKDVPNLHLDNRPSPGTNFWKSENTQAVGQRKRPNTGERGPSLPTTEATQPTTSEKTDITTDSSDQSYPISPISAPASSVTDWEDRFVVNMPSAREPNPLHLNTQQISKFQQSIERVHKEGGTMLDPETLPSPRTTTPEDKIMPSDQREKKMIGLDGQEPSPDPPSYESKDNEGPGEPPRYYSPDEIGKPRFSTIWEESPGQSTNTPFAANADGSFLGCKEINGPNDKNPDEILLFSTTDERPRVIDIPGPKSKIPREGRRATTHALTPAAQEKALPQQDRNPTSQNSNPTQCSKQLPKTMCKDTNCRLPQKSENLSKENVSKPSLKENRVPQGNTTTKTHEQKPHRKSDDVFIITPTITRTMVTITDLRAHAQKTPGTQEPTSRAAGEIITGTRTKSQAGSSTAGLRRVTQNSWERQTATCTPSKPTSPNSVSPKTTSPTQIPTIKPRGTEPERRTSDKPRPIRGFIRTSGASKATIEGPSGLPRSNPPQSHPPCLAPGSGNTPPMVSRGVFEPSPELKTSLVQDNAAQVASASTAPDVSPYIGTTSSGPEISPQNSISRDGSEERLSPRELQSFEVAELDGQQVYETPREEGVFHFNVTDFNADILGDPAKQSESGTKRPESTEDSADDPPLWTLIKDAIIDSAIQLQQLYSQVMVNRDNKAMLVRIAFNSILMMIEHCLLVLKNFLAFLSLYNSTGAWPRPSRKDLVRSLIDHCQAALYVVTLGFCMMIIGRAAGYVVLVSTWVIWFAKPFAWFFGALGRALC